MSYMKKKKKKDLRYNLCFDNYVQTKFGENEHLFIIYKLCSKMLMFFKFDFNKIELCVKLDIFKIELYVCF